MSPPATCTMIAKVDVRLGLVFGYGIVCCTETDGSMKPYYDTQGDHIPEESMLKATTEFMLGDRELHDMHNGVMKGKVVHSFPLTAEVAKAYGILVDKTGWLISVKPDDPAILAKFESGEYTGFSIGGERVVDEAGDKV